MTSSGKPENDCSTGEIQLNKIKKNRRKTLMLCLTIGFFVFVLFFYLLRYKPKGYHTHGTTWDPNTSGFIHHYITYLASELYNGVQYGDPFDLTILENGLNQAIAASGWPRFLEGILFAAPEVIIQPGEAVLMGSVYITGGEFVVTIVIQPLMNDQGQINLHVDKVCMGAVNITPLARLIAQKIIDNQFPVSGRDALDLRAKLTGSLLHDVPFDPVFRLEDKYVRLNRFKMSQGHIIVHLIPLPRS
jgi:hypothetical protein